MMRSAGPKGGEGVVVIIGGGAVTVRDFGGAVFGDHEALRHRVVRQLEVWRKENVITYLK